MIIETVGGRKVYFQSELAKHSAGCYSTQCLVKHVRVYYFETEHAVYAAESLDSAAQMWMADGGKTLKDVSGMG